MSPKTSSRSASSASSSAPDPSEAPGREVQLHVPLKTFDLYVLSVAEIAAETGNPRGMTVEKLMAYGLALPEADELIHGFIRGNLTLFPPAEQNRQVVERDTRRLELEAPLPECCPPTQLGRKLDRRPRNGTACPPSERPSEMGTFISDNPETFRQVRASSHDFLVRWVMLHLLEAAQARQRVHCIAHEFWKQFPGVRQGIEARAVRRSAKSGQPPQTSLLKRQSPLGRTGSGLP